jgi:hypothetical protein
MEHSINFKMLSPCRTVWTHLVRIWWGCSEDQVPVRIVTEWEWKHIEWECYRMGIDGMGMMTWEWYMMGMDGMGMLQNGNGWNRNDTECYRMIQNGWKISDSKETCFETLTVEHIRNILDHSEALQTHFNNICWMYSYHSVHSIHSIHLTIDHILRCNSQWLVCSCSHRYHIESSLNHNANGRPDSESVQRWRERNLQDFPFNNSDQGLFLKAKVSSS